MKYSKIWKSTFREIRQSFGRFAAIMAIVALGVGFYAGLKVTRTAMVNRIQDFYEDYGFYDYRLMSTYGFEQEDVDYLAEHSDAEAVEGGISMDMLFVNPDGEEAVAKFYSLTETVNTLEVKAGRLPEAADECIVDADLFGEDSIGETITLSDANGEDDLDSFSGRTYTIVGTAVSPLYIQYERGNTSLGNGRISGFIYLTPEGFDLDYYTEIYVRFSEQLDLYSDEYEDYLEEQEVVWEELTRTAADMRFARVKDDAEEEYADALDEYETEKADAEAELADAKAELDDAAAEIADAEQEIADGKVELADAKAELADGKQELADARETIAEKEQELADGEAELADGIEEYNSGNSDLASARQKLEDLQAQLDEQTAQLDAQEAELTQAEQLLAVYNTYVSLQTYLQAITVSPGDAASLAPSGTVLTGMEGISDGSVLLADGTLWIKGAASDACLIPGYALGQTETTSLTTYLTQLGAVLTKAAGDSQTTIPTAEELETARKKIASYRAQIADAQQQIDDGWTEVNDGERQLAEAWKKIEDAQAEIEDGKQALADAKQEVEDGEAELADAEQEIADAEAELADGEAELTDGKAEYEDGLAEYEDGVEEFNEEIADAEAELADARQEIDDMEEPETYVLGRDTNVGYVCFESDSGIVDGIAVVFPVFFFLVAALVCITTMNRMVEEQRTQIGVLKALGYSDLTIMMKYVFYSGSAALIGCIGGFFIGTWGFPKVIWYAYCMMYNVEHVDYIFDGKLAAISVVVSLLCSAGTTWLSCRVELSEAAAILMRPKAPKAGKRILLERIPLIWNRLKFLQKVSVRNILRYKKRLFMMIAGIGGCTALVLTGFGIEDSIADVASMQFEEIQIYDLSVSLTDSLDDEMTEKLTTAAGEDSAEWIAVADSSMDLIGSESRKSVSVVTAQDGVDITPYLNLHDEDGNPIAYPGEGEAVVTDSVADKLEISVGDTITLESEDMRTITATVTGINRNFIYDYMYLSESTYTAGMGEAPSYKTIYLNKTEEADSHLLSAALMGTDGVTNVTVNADTMERFSSMMASLDIIVLVVILCAAGLAFIVLYNLTYINITERVREIATIKVLGFTRGETAAYVFRENIVLTVLGTLPGLLLGKWLHSFVMSQIVVDMVSFDVRILTRSYLVSPVLTLVFALCVNLMMYSRLDRISMTESLKSVD